MNYKELIVWQKALDLSVLIYKLTENFPQKEKFGLTSQIRRPSVSVPSNIAEGYSRASKKYFLNFLRIALGSLSELETQLLLSEKIGFAKDSEMQNIKKLILEVQKMLSKLIKKHSF